MAICRKNLQHASELQKQYHDKYTKPRSYVSGEKVWFNSKYIKIKQNCKLEAKFFGSFRVLHLVGKQAYKLELPKKETIYDIFYILLLEQDSTKKRQVDKTTSRLKFESDSNGEEYEVKAICEAQSMQGSRKATY